MSIVDLYVNARNNSGTLDPSELDTYKAATIVGTSQMYDEFSGKYLKVPNMLVALRSISNSWLNNGVHVPVAGFNNRGRVVGIKPKSLEFNPNREEQDALYEAQLNPIVSDHTGQYIMGNLTLQTKNSALSNISVVNMIQTMDVELQLITESFIFDFITPNLLMNIHNTLNKYFEKWYTNNGIESVEINVYASDLDKKLKTVRVDIEVVPTSILEKLRLSFIIK